MLLTRNKVVFSILIILVGYKLKHENPTKFGAYIVYTPIAKELTVHQNIRLKTSASFETQTFSSVWLFVGEFLFNIILRKAIE